MMENREYFIDKDGCKIHAKLEFPKDKQEKMPVVILVHGLTGNMEETHILGVKDTLNEIGYAVLRVEMYGHGMSDGAFENHTILEWVSQLLFVIDHVREFDFVSDIYLMGHSQGGYTVMLCAALKADQIKGLVPLSPAISIPGNCRRGDMLGGSFDPESIPHRIHLKPDFDIGENYIRTAMTLPVDEAIKAYKGPVLIVHGTADDAIPVSYARYAAELYADATLVEIPDDLHCYDYHLDMVQDAVRDWFLRR